jgi:hypothetical protein
MVFYLIRVGSNKINLKEYYPPLRERGKNMGFIFSAKILFRNHRYHDKKNPLGNGF